MSTLFDFILESAEDRVDPGPDALRALVGLLADQSLQDFSVFLLLRACVLWAQSGQLMLDKLIDARIHLAVVKMLLNHLPAPSITDQLVITPFDVSKFLTNSTAEAASRFHSLSAIHRPKLLLSLALQYFSVCTNSGEVLPRK